MSVKQRKINADRRNAGIPKKDWPYYDRLARERENRSASRRYCVTVEYRTALGTLKRAPVPVWATDIEGAVHVASNYAREQLGDAARIISVVALED